MISATIGAVASVFFGLLIARYVYLQIAKANAYKVSTDIFHSSIVLLKGITCRIHTANPSKLVLRKKKLVLRKFFLF